MLRSENEGLAGEEKNSRPSPRVGEVCGGEMQQRYEFMDLIVAVGLCATIVTSGLLFMVANGTWQIRTVGSESTGQPTGILTGMEWLQPVLGQAIVDHTLLERNHAKGARAAIAELDGLTLERNRWQNSPYGYLDSITTGASWAEGEHAARVQAVMGRSIVNFTRREVRSGVWSSVERAAHDNPHMIGVTEVMGQKMDAAFLASWQPNLGRGIVAATQESETRSTLRQERLGTAIVELATVQSVYEPVRAAIQEQLGAATVVATLTELQDGRGQSDHLTAYRAADASTQDALPGIPTTIFVMASLILLSLFTAGLFVFSPKLPGVHDDDLVQMGIAAQGHSKPA